VDIRLNIEIRLKNFISPSSYNRISELARDLYLQSYKTWRILFKKDECSLTVLRISTGYDLETLDGRKKSSWGDVDLHREFCRKF
jgi:hypothetical protein